MVIRSTFYDTTPGEGVKETEWAQSAPSRGSLYGVVGAGDLNLTAHPTAPYAVNLSPGKFWSHGVWNESTGSETVQCVAPANTAVRWDLIAANNDWQPTGGGPTSFKVVQGSSVKALPTGMETRPGVVVDQPLWLVKWQGGQSRPQEIIDLRCWAHDGGVEIVDKLALDYLKRPGAAVKLGRSIYRYESKGNGVWDWAEYEQRTVRDGIADVRPNGAGEATFTFPPFPNATTSIQLTDATYSFSDVVIPKVVGLSNGSCTVRTYFGSNGSGPRPYPATIHYIASGY